MDLRSAKTPVFAEVFVCLRPEGKAMSGDEVRREKMEADVV